MSDDDFDDDEFAELRAKAAQAGMAAEGTAEVLLDENGFPIVSQRGKFAAQMNPLQLKRQEELRKKAEREAQEAKLRAQEARAAAFGGTARAAAERTKQGKEEDKKSEKVPEPTKAHLDSRVVGMMKSGIVTKKAANASILATGGRRGAKGGDRDKAEKAEVEAAPAPAPKPADSDSDSSDEEERKKRIAAKRASLAAQLGTGSASAPSTAAAAAATGSHHGSGSRTPSPRVALPAAPSARKIAGTGATTGGASSTPAQPAADAAVKRSVRNLGNASSGAGGGAGAAGVPSISTHSLPQGGSGSGRSSPYGHVAAAPPPPSAAVAAMLAAASGRASPGIPRAPSPASGGAAGHFHANPHHLRMMGGASSPSGGSSRVVVSRAGTVLEAAGGSSGRATPPGGPFTVTTTTGGGGHGGSAASPAVTVMYERKSVTPPNSFPPGYPPNANAPFVGSPAYNAVTHGSSRAAVAFGPTQSATGYHQTGVAGGLHATGASTRLQFGGGPAAGAGGMTIATPLPSHPAALGPAGINSLAAGPTISSNMRPPLLPSGKSLRDLDHRASVAFTTYGSTRSGSTVTAASIVPVTITANPMGSLGGAASNPAAAATSSSGGGMAGVGVSSSHIVKNPLAAKNIAASAAERLASLSPATFRAPLPPASVPVGASSEQVWDPQTGAAYVSSGFVPSSTPAPARCQYHPSVLALRSLPLMDVPTGVMLYPELRARLEALRSGATQDDINALPAAMLKTPERYLDAADFKRVMEASPEEFEGYPAWKQRALRRKTGLYVR